MRQEYLNAHSGFYRGQYVKVKRIDSNETCTGVVSTTYMGPINRASPHGQQTDHIYVQFNGKQGRAMYTKWLLMGSRIFVNKSNNRKQKCVICNIVCDEDGLIDTLRVFDDDGSMAMINAYQYTIKAKDIDSMLIWRDGYEIVAE